MPADTYSAILGVLLMGTGNDNATWGSNANAGVFTILEEAIAGMLSSAVTGGTLDLTSPGPPTTSSQVHYKTLYFSGTLSGAQTVVVPALTKTWTVVNATTGDIFMKTPTGTAINIPQGTTKHVWCDGANVHRSDLDDIGKVEMFAGQYAPAGKLECNGSYLSRTDYPELFNSIGTVWGTSVGTDFRLPLMTDTGRFPRARLPGTTDAGTYQANQNLAHNHTGSITGGGTTDADGAHTHLATSTVTDPGHTHTLNGGSTSLALAQALGQCPNSAGAQQCSSITVSIDTAVTGIAVTTTVAAVGTHTHTFSITGTLTSSSSGGTEARPEAAVFRFCIRY